MDENHLFGEDAPVSTMMRKEGVRLEHIALRGHSSTTGSGLFKRPQENKNGPEEILESIRKHNATDIGSAAAGPLYGAFPVAAVFMKKGVKFSNILIFIGAWSTTKIPMFLFEVASMGRVFAITRLLINIPGIIIIAKVLTALMKEDEVKSIYETAEKMVA